MSTQSTGSTRATQIIQQQTQVNQQLANLDRHVSTHEVTQVALNIAKSTLKP